MKNFKVIVSALVILIWSFTFASVDITGKVVRNYAETGGAGFFPVLSLLFLIGSFVFVWYYLKDEESLHPKV